MNFSYHSKLKAKKNTRKNIVFLSLTNGCFDVLSNYITNVR